MRCLSTAWITATTRSSIPRRASTCWASSTRSDNRGHRLRPWPVGAPSRLAAAAGDDRNAPGRAFAPGEAPECLVVWAGPGGPREPMVGRLGRTPRKPVHKCVGDREPEGEDGGGEVSLRPRAGSGRRDAPLGSGGKSSGPFGHEEGVGGEDATDVVLPADVRVPLEVVQSQLALQVLGYALGTPALLDASDDLFPRHRFRE